MADDIFTDIHGLHVGKHFPEEAIRSVLDYVPQPGDLFIVTYPKCGTTWMQQIVYHILMNGNLPDDELDVVLRLPFLEVQGADAGRYGPKPGAYKTHLPFDKHPYSPEAKYIYVARNPYDCCVSFFYHTKNFPVYHYEDGTFDDFFDKFIAGKVDFGDYLDHLLSWYAHRNDANVLFVTFEDLKRDPGAWVLRVAEFMGEDYVSRLREDKGLLEKIVSAVSFTRMKGSLNAKFRKEDHEGKDEADVSPMTNSQYTIDALHPAVLKGLKAFEAFFAKPMTGDFARKGEVGDWKRHFDEKHVEKMKQYIASRMAGPIVTSLWSEIPV
ncbi:sulfotransferase 1C2-like [Haemaphysalis longicornis]